MQLFNDLSLQFNLRKEQGISKKPQRIYCRLTSNKERRNFSTGYFITPNSWCKATERVKTKDETAKEINDNLTLLKQKIINCYFEVKQSKGNLSILDRIQTEVFKAPSPIDTMPSEPDESEIKALAEKYIKDLKEKFDADIISEGTFKSYKSAIVIFLEFANLYYGANTTYIASIDKLFFFNFETHLMVKKKLKSNYAHKVLSNTRKLFNFAYDLGILESKFSIRFKVKYTNPHRAILNISELKILEGLEFNKPHQEEARDCFIFQCYTGLAYSEIKALRVENIKLIDGDRWIVINRKKTGTESKLILLPIASDILDKYTAHPYCNKIKQLLPVRSNGKYNIALKEVQAAGNLNTTLYSHIGRHIFASTVALQFGLPMETLAKVLGHTNLRTTMIYGKILDNKIKNDFAALRERLK
jgi:integrase